MPFFERILKQPELAGADRQERRLTPRYAIRPEFDLKASLSLGSLGQTRPPRGGSRSGLSLKCNLLDCSEGGVRVQTGPGLKLKARDLCDLRLAIDEFKLTVPCQISNFREDPQGWVFGLRLEISDEPTWVAYYQLLEVVALGATLRLHRKSDRPGESGYLEESYVNSRPARLSIWRDATTHGLVAAEFRLKRHLIRMVAGGGVEYLTGAADHPARAAQAEEIERLFTWVVQNLSPAVPDDVRGFLLAFTRHP